VTSLKTELEDAIGFISQSKLLIARLEGELSETGAELEQSGSAAEKKLAFLDSEMRKLWGVSNDRNKKSITANQQALDGLKVSVSRHEERLKQVDKSLDSFENSYVKLEKALAGQESKLSLASGEMAITREAIGEDLTLLRSELDGLKALGAQIKENQKAILAIDTSRKQINERLVDLGRKVNEMQLQSPSASP